MKHVEIKLEYEGPIEPPPEMLEELFARMLQDQPNERLVWMIAECAKEYHSRQVGGRPI